MNACADKRLLIHALADGEVDAANAVALEAHLRDCAGCQAEHARILALRAELRREPLGYAAPERLSRAIDALLSAEAAIAPSSTGNVVPLQPRRPGVLGHVASWRWASGALTGLAAGLLLFVVLPRTPQPRDSDDLVAGHVRSLMADHLTDVAATDKHVVKPWFNGKIDFAPPVPNLDADGFPLGGGRLDVVEGRDVAALVYRRRLHVINVFVHPVGKPGTSAADETREGYTILRWTAGGLAFSAVSDLNGKEMREFRALFIKRAAG